MNFQFVYIYCGIKKWFDGFLICIPFVWHIKVSKSTETLPVVHEVALRAKALAHLSMASKPALSHIQRPIQLIPAAYFLGVKRLFCEADHLPPSTAEVKNGGAIPPLPRTSSWHSA
jgi:hypothetical protein